ncbi:hypothetical protein M885DRAFT_619504 [Pelagophyceae sp. CCMP2097]|nr:hypothetical protein M885DRAFT_619504 [Pelagophyceae sp. CCMP2097]
MRVFLIGSVAGAAASLPRVDYGALAGGDPAAAATALHALQTTGILSVDGVAGLSGAAAAGLGGLAKCLAAKADAPATVLRDGVERRTVGWRIGAADLRDGLRPANVGADCGGNAAALRLVVDAASTVLFGALDRASAGGVVMPRSAAARDYTSYADVFGLGDQLEHMHAYYGADVAEAAEPAPSTLETHTDAGLLLATILGREDGGESLFEVDLGDGAGLVAVRPAPDSVIFMAGDGGNAWLAEGAQFRAAPHRLWIRQRGALETRAWYGRMYLPPADAIVRSSGLDVAAHLEAARVSAAGGDAGVVGCGIQGAAQPAKVGYDFEARRLASVDAQFCKTSKGQDGVLCWLSCASIESLPCGADRAACVDSKTNVAVDGGTHCGGSCELGCLAPAAASGGEAGAATFNASSLGAGGFCFGEGADMHMDGFRSVFETHRPQCLNLLFTEWTLDTPGRFAAGAVGVAGLGLLAEALTLGRRKLHGAKTGRRSRKAATLGLYCAQLVLGYFLMLAAMSYSAELFAAACLGLTLGHALFNLSDTPQLDVDPCCAFKGEIVPLEYDERTPPSCCAPQAETEPAFLEEGKTNCCGENF